VKAKRRGASLETPPLLPNVSRMVATNDNAPSSIPALSAGTSKLLITFVNSGRNNTSAEQELTIELRLSGSAGAASAANLSATVLDPYRAARKLRITKLLVLLFPQMRFHKLDSDELSLESAPSSSDLKSHDDEGEEEYPRIPPQNSCRFNGRRSCKQLPGESKPELTFDLLLPAESDSCFAQLLKSLTSRTNEARQLPFFDDKAGTRSLAMHC
jgi:hypothetical protein